LTNGITSSAGVSIEQVLNGGAEMLSAGGSEIMFEIHNQGPGTPANKMYLSFDNFPANNACTHNRRKKSRTVVSTKEFKRFT
jgi:hypothetical protein